MPEPTIVAPVDPRDSSHLAYHPVGMDASIITSGYWARWQEDNRTITTPHSFAWLERDHTIDNLRRLDPDSTVTDEREGLWFTDSDLYKAMEALAWEIGRTGDPELTTLLSDLIAIVGAAQDDDGYINSYIQAGLGTRWDNLVMSHELYCIGHLIQAGVAHKRSTGRHELLDIAIKAADLVVEDFGDLRRGDTDGHEEIEMALVELYRETGTTAYLALAQQFIDVRGHGVLPPNDHAESPYYQDATPVREETTVVGHAVRAIYLLAGVVDVYLETGEQALLDAAQRQWRAMTATKTYITGAVGSRFVGEAFGEAYELPPDLAYGETCATIGNIMVSWRLLLATGESRYGDAIERALFNLFSASTSLDRVGFFYNNPAQRRRALPAAPTDSRPARADAPGTRPAWYECACCPPNIMRTVASLASYISTHTDEAVQLHQFIASKIAVDLHAGHVAFELATNYPVEETVAITILETPTEEWSLEIRLPDWATDATIAVNGESPVPAVANSLGYISVARAWTAEDFVELIFPMKPRYTVAHPSVDAVRGAVAIERGPIVYAFESVDQEAGVDLNHIQLVHDAPLVEKHENHGGAELVSLHVEGFLRDDSEWADTGWRPASDARQIPGRSVTLTAIPYFAWANRGPSVMRIFVPVAPS